MIQTRPKISDGVTYNKEENEVELVSRDTWTIVDNFNSSFVEGEPGKPPPGYKCKICESTEVSPSLPNI